MQDTGVATPRLERHSMFERSLALPVGTWSVARKQLIGSVGGHVRVCVTPTSIEVKLSSSATRPPFPSELTLLYVFSLSNSLFFVSFLHLFD